MVRVLCLYVLRPQKSFKKNNRNRWKPWPKDSDNFNYTYNIYICRSTLASYSCTYSINTLIRLLLDLNVQLFNCMYNI